MADSKLRNLNCIEYDIMRHMPCDYLEYIYGMGHRINKKFDELEWKEQKEIMIDYLKEGMWDTDPVMGACTSIWEKNTDYKLAVYFMSEAWRTCVEDYKTPLLEYSEDIPIRTAQFEAMMWEMFSHYFIEYADVDNPKNHHAHDLYDMIGNTLFFDRDWDLPEESVKDPLVLEALAIEPDYFFEIDFREITNFEESLNWLMDDLSEYYGQ